MQNLMCIFQDMESIKCGEWSRFGFAVRYGYRENDYIQIGLYREPSENEEYAGTYTLQVFDGDAVIACHKVHHVEEEQA